MTVVAGEARTNCVTYGEMARLAKISDSTQQSLGNAKLSGGVTTHLGKGEETANKFDRMITPAGDSCKLCSNGVGLIVQH